MKAANLLLLFVLLLTLVSCAKKEEQRTIYREGEAPVTQVAADDPEMNAAIQKAKDTLGQFVAELKKPGVRLFNIKVPLPSDSGSSEHIWVEDISFSNGRFKGKLANEPMDISSKKLGDPVEVAQEDVEDWVIMDGEKMEGGFTAKLLMERESKKK